MAKPDIRKILEKIAPAPYFDWGAKQLLANGGYAKGSWSASKETRERMFVFNKDIEFAKECLRRDYEEPTEHNAILKLCGSRRTGNRRFPRFGWLLPQQCCIIGREEFLKHRGKTSAWESLYALVSQSSINESLKTSILAKIDGMEKCGESKKRIFSGNIPKFIRVRNHYQVQFSAKEMNVILPILCMAAVPIQKNSDKGMELADNRSDKNAVDFGTSHLEQYHSPLKQKEIVDALSTLYRKFPEEQFKDFRLFAKNKEFWENYNKSKHGVKGFEIEELSMIVAHSLAELTKFRRKDGLTFFTGRLKIAKQGDVTYIEDFGFVPEAREYYHKFYLPKLNPKMFLNKEGLTAITANDFKYPDTFVASLLKFMFGNGKGYGIGGPVEHLVKYADEMKSLAKNFSSPQKAVSKFFQFKDQPKKMLLLLSDFSLNDIKQCQREYCALAYAIFVSIFPKAYERYDFIEDSSEFYTRSDVNDGRDANRKFNSRYKFLDEFAFKNKRKPSFTNCAILDEALRNGDMPQWSLTIMQSLYENVFGRKDDVETIKHKPNKFPIAKISNLIKQSKIRYSYFVDENEHYASIHLGTELENFIKIFKGGLKASRNRSKFPRLTLAKNVLTLE